MASKPEMPMDAEPKPQKETSPESDSPSSPPKISSKNSDFSAPSDPESRNCDMGYPSFSKLLEGVMAANSAVSTDPFAKNLGIQGQFGMSHQEALASVTAKAAQAHAQMQLQDESAKCSTEPPSITQSQSTFVTTPTVIQEETPSLEQKTSLQEGGDKNSSNHNSDSKDSSGQKFSDMQSECVSPSSLAPMSLRKKLVDKKDFIKERPSNFSNEHMEDVPRTPKFDGYSWRKYGQKQVKSSGSSRSYYRCTHFHCCAKKKVQHLDVTGQIIEVVYKGDHNHDPPQSFKGSSQKRHVPSSAPAAPIEPSHTSVQKLDDQNTPTCGMKLQQVEILSTCENLHDNVNTSASITQQDAGEVHMKIPDPTLRLKNEATILPTQAERCRSSNSDELAMTDPMKERDLAPLKKRRIKETGQTFPDTVYRSLKERKSVVHAAGGVGTFTDGYRWRKYGQKMVKGSPHPRSYYRCSSTGCPVRKHVERATDDSTAFIVTYEGKHDHDLPVPKKRNSSPSSSAPLAPMVTTSANQPPSQKLRTKSLPSSQDPPAQQSREADSNLNEEKTIETGADKVLESARTLLSIGIELKSC